MGASCSPAYFETFSTFIEWVVMQVTGSDSLIHYMDDFLFVGGSDDLRSSVMSCQGLVDHFGDICKNFGVPLAADKSVGPSTTLVFLGLQIDQSDSFNPRSEIEIDISQGRRGIQCFISYVEGSPIINRVSFLCL